jgi:hypothetical protein
MNTLKQVHGLCDELDAKDTEIETLVRVLRALATSNDGFGRTRPEDMEAAQSLLKQYDTSN